MDEMEDKGPESASEDARESTADSAKKAAMDLKDEAEKTLCEIKSRGVMGFFSFEHMYFPIIARYVFIIVVILTAIGTVLGVASGVLGLFSAGFFAGIATIVCSLIGGLLSIIGTRIMFEMILLGFKMYESMQAVRENTRK